MAIYTSQGRTLADALGPWPRPQSVVPGLMMSRSLSIWWGHPGSLKSNLLMDMCFAVATGHQWLPDMPLGEHRGVAVHPCPVLWLDVDNGEDVMRERLAAFAQGYNVSEAALHWLSFPDPAVMASQNLTYLAEYALEIQAGVIVIDNLLRVAGVKDENSSEMDVPMRNLRRLCELTGASVALIHHSKKDNRGRAGAGLRGHSSIEGAIDSSFMIERIGDTVTVEHVKARRRPVETFGALWTYDLMDDGETLKTARLYRSEAITKKAVNEKRLRDEILEVMQRLSDAPKAELMEAVSGRRENKVSTIKRLVLESLLVEYKIGRQVHLRVP